MSLENLDSATVFENEEILSGWLTSYNSSLDTSVGTALRELMIKPAARYYTSQEEDINTVITNLSLSESTNETMVEALLSNYNVTRKEGSTSSGYLAVYTSSNTDLYIPSTTLFTVGTDVLEIDNTYIGVANVTDVLDASRYRVLQQYDTTTWYMIIPANTVDPTNNVLSIGQTATTNITLEDVVRTEISSTFSGGTSQETLTEMKARATEGVTAKVPSGKAHVEALFADYTSVNVQDVSVIGMGDSEMLRGRANVYGVNPGGRVDIYSRTASYPTSTTLSLTGTLVDVALSKWKVLISKTDAPGFYMVNSVSHADVSGVMTYTGDVDYTFSCDTSNEVYVPDCTTGEDARYTKYQTAEATFIFEGLSGTTVGETTTFSVSVLLLPSIGVLQDAISDPEFRNPAGDYLVRAPIPMFVGVEALIKYPDYRDTPDANTLKAAVAAAVNSTPLKRGYVTTTELSHAILEADSNLVVVAPMILTGFLYDPSGEQHYYRSVDTLTVEADLTQAVSANTVSFFCTSSSVSISLNRTNDYLV